MFRKSSLAVAVVALLLILQACGVNIQPQESCNFVQNSQLQRVSWKSDVPVRLYIHQSVNSSHYQAIDNAVKRWNQVAGRNLLMIEAYGVSGQNFPRRDGYSLIYWMNEWEDNKPTEQARTTVYWSGNRIYEADIRINNKNFNFSSGGGSGIDLESLLVHELGHVLGMAHNSEPHSVMYKSLPGGIQRLNVSDDDREALFCEY